MKGSDFIFDCVYLLYSKCHNVNLKRDGSNIDSSDWLKNKNATINSIYKKDNKCFQYAATVALNHEEVKTNLKRLSKIKLFINKYYSEEIYYLSEKDNWKNFRKCNLTIALNILYAKKWEKKYTSYVSKHNSNRGKQIILLMIPNGEVLDSYIIYIINKNNVKTPQQFLSFELPSFLCNKKQPWISKKKKNKCKNKDFCNIIMPFENTKILDFNINTKNRIKQHLIFLQSLNIS